MKTILLGLSLFLVFAFFPVQRVYAECIPPSAEGCLDPNGNISHEVIPIPDNPPESFDVVLIVPPVDIFDIPDKEEHNHKIFNRPPKLNCYPFMRCW